MFLHFICRSTHHIILAADAIISHDLARGTVDIRTGEKHEWLGCDPSITYGDFATVSKAANTHAIDNDHEAILFPA